jgi:hypothetical protein
VVGGVQNKEAAKEVAEDPGLLSVVSVACGEYHARRSRCSGLQSEEGVLMTTAGYWAKCTTPSPDLTIGLFAKPPHTSPEFPHRSICIRPQLCMLSDPLQLQSAARVRTVTRLRLSNRPIYSVTVPPNGKAPRTRT